MKQTNKMTKKLFHTFRGKLFWISILLVSVALLIVNLLCSSIYLNSIQERIVQSNQRYIEDYKDNVNELLQKVIRYCNKFLTDEQINRFVVDYQNYKSEKSYLAKVHETNVKQELQNLMNLNQGIVGVEVVTENYSLNQGQVLSDYASHKEKYWYLKRLMTGKDGSVILMPLSNTKQSANQDKKNDIFQIVGVSTETDQKWYAVLNVNISFINQYKDVVVLDSDGVILWGSYDIDDPELIREIVQHSTQSSSNTFEYQIDKEDRDVVYVNSNGNQWIFASLIERQIISVIEKKTWTFSLSLSAGLFVAAAVILYYLSKRLAQPLYDLSKRVRNINDFNKELYEGEGHRLGGYWLNKWGFRSKVTLFFSLVVILLTTVFVVCFYIFVRGNVLETEKTLVTENIKLVRNKVEYEITNIEQIAHFLSVNEHVQDVVDKGVQNTEQTGEISRLIVSEELLTGYIESIELFDNQLKKVYSSNRNNYHTTNAEKQMIEQLNQSRNFENWMGTSTNIFDNYQIPYVRKIWKLDEENQKFVDGGYVVVNLSEELIEKKMDENSVAYPTNMIIADTKYCIISTKNKSLIGEIAESVPTNYEDSLETVNGVNVYKGEGEFVLMLAFENSEWILISVIRYEDLLGISKLLLLYSLVGIGFISIVVLLVGNVLANLILKPIYLVKEGIAEIQMGNLDVNEYFEPKDDLRILCNEIYQMAADTSRLLSEIYDGKLKENELERRKKEAELISLQCQINPHFLYNTFSTIKFLVDLGELDEAKEMITLVGKLFRQSVFRGQILVDVREEVEHIQAYIEIQNIRYKNKIKVSWDLHDEIYKYKTLKFILQPVVENAIKYGIENLTTIGRIRILGFVEENKLVFEIYDNAAGISKSKLIKIRKQISGELESSRVGLKNISDRIKLYYGDEYGIYISSENGETCVRMELKLIERDNEKE